MSTERIVLEDSKKLDTTNLHGLVQSALFDAGIRKANPYMFVLDGAEGGRNGDAELWYEDEANLGIGRGDINATEVMRAVGAEVASRLRENPHLQKLDKCLNDLATEFDIRARMAGNMLYDTSFDAGIFVADKVGKVFGSQPGMEIDYGNEDNSPSPDWVTQQMYPDGYNPAVGIVDRVAVRFLRGLTYTTTTIELAACSIPGIVTPAPPEPEKTIVFPESTPDQQEQTLSQKAQSAIAEDFKGAGFHDVEQLGGIYNTSEGSEYAIFTALPPGFTKDQLGPEDSLLFISRVEDGEVMGVNMLIPERALLELKAKQEGLPTPQANLDDPHNDFWAYILNSETGELEPSGKEAVLRVINIEGADDPSEGVFVNTNGKWTILNVKKGGAEDTRARISQGGGGILRIRTIRTGGSDRPNKEPTIPRPSSPGGEEATPTPEEVKKSTPQEADSNLLQTLEAWKSEKMTIPAGERYTLDGNPVRLGLIWDDKPDKYLDINFGIEFQAVILGSEIINGHIVTYFGFSTDQRDQFFIPFYDREDNDDQSFWFAPQSGHAIDDTVGQMKFTEVKPSEVLDLTKDLLGKPVIGMAVVSSVGLVPSEEQKNDPTIKALFGQIKLANKLTNYLYQIGVGKSELGDLPPFELINLRSDRIDDPSKLPFLNQFRIDKKDIPPEWQK